jgi:tetratricopeptide (TPR) repeat protein
MAEMKKREGKHSEAAAYWERLLAFSPVLGVYPHIELSKYYEHKARDFAKAKEYADQARRIASGSVYRDSSVKLDIERRGERLSRKISRQIEQAIALAGKSAKNAQTSKAGKQTIGG